MDRVIGLGLVNSEGARGVIDGKVGGFEGKRGRVGVAFDTYMSCLVYCQGARRSWAHKDS